MARCGFCDDDTERHDPETGACLVQGCPCEQCEPREDPADVADRLGDERTDEELLKND